MLVNQNEAPVTKEVLLDQKLPVEKEPDAAPPVEEKKDEPFSKRFSELAKQRRKFELERKASKQREADLAAREARVAEMEKRPAPTPKKKNPIEVLMAEGYTYEDAAKYVLSEGKLSAEDRIAEVEKKFESRLEQYEREKEEREQKALESEKAELEEEERAQTLQVHAGIEALFLSKPDDYDLLNQFHSEDDPMPPKIYSLIEDHWNAELKKQEEDESHKPRLLSYKDACDLMEQFLEQEAERVFNNSKKLKAKYLLQQQDKKDDERAPPSKTLSNAITTTSTETNKGWISDEERNRRALALLGD